MVAIPCHFFGAVGATSPLRRAIPAGSMSSLAFGNYRGGDSNCFGSMKGVRVEEGEKVNADLIQG